MIDYNGRRFRKPDGDPHTVAEYHQEGDLVWADFSGGTVRRGSIAGTSTPDGTLHMGYTMVLTSGEVVCGRTVNTPEYTVEGRLRLREEWERFGPHACAGTSYIDEVG